MENIADHSFPKGRLTHQHNIVKESIMNGFKSTKNEENNGHTNKDKSDESMQNYIVNKANEIISNYQIDTTKLSDQTATYRTTSSATDDNDYKHINHRYLPDWRWPSGRKDDFLRLYDHAYAAYRPYQELEQQKNHI